ncbi:hypothetical protein NE237_027833 [Protea cynaroides]|uniref:AP-5 complex subunit beta-1 n=1 Tax=Protea cynaroides TaxID=273540 RepID=A0A9Q0JTD2_9MAGN|nr:hypothetical protein NE237_027833 [Protea cynaroides]
MEKPLKQLSSQEWETLIEDFQSGTALRDQRFTQYQSLAFLDLALSSVLRKDFPLKLQVIVFLEEFFEVLIRESVAEEALRRLMEALRAVVQAPVDGISVTYHLKEEMMVSSTSIMISMDGLKNGHRYLENLTELLLTVINRPNHSVDRQTRGVACECLRELERAYPCLLADVVGHLWNLCHNERTHASQSYILLLTSVIHDLVIYRTNVSILTTSVPLFPFNVPQSLLAAGASVSTRELSVSNVRELRRVTAFLLETPQILTPCGMMEFMSMLMRVAVALELQASLLKVQFSGLLHSYDPILCHVVLMLYSHFLDAFDDQEGEIARRLMLISKEVQHHLVFRLLALHWLLGFIGLPMKKEATKRSSIATISLNVYPSVFDPLALKAIKLDLLAYCAICLDKLSLENPGTSGEEMDAGISLVKLFEDGLVSVSAFKWLPPWSTETAVAFRNLHKFLIGSTPHSVSDDPSTNGVLMESTIFQTLQRLLVGMALESRRLVPVIVAFIDRLLACHSHHWLGERLLQIFDEQLLPKVNKDYHLASYFLVFDKIAENNTIPPHGLLELLTAFVVSLVEKHGPETGLKSWSLGSKVLRLCRTMLMHHHSSRVFLALSRILAFTCLHFPDLEVRDNARIYLRMLMCIPGKKLRYILNLGEELPGISPSQPSSSFFRAQYPQPFRDLKKSRNISSYVHIERVIPLLVKQSWSLSLLTLGIGSENPVYLEGIRDSQTPVDVRDVEGSSEIQIVSETEGINQPQEPLRVMDSKVSEILAILRKHFSCIPDFRHMPGLKIQIPCILRFESEPFSRIWGIDLPANNWEDSDALPAMYATVLNFSSSSPYGSIPSFHIPFLLGEPLRNDYTSASKNCLDIVPAENGSVEQEIFRAPLKVVLEPREPMPGLVDVAIQANTENGQIIHGQLQSIMVGIEDMFLKVRVPSDIAEDAIPAYYSDLFYALWEACGSSSKTGREIYPLKGGKGVTAISGTQSVKLLAVPAEALIGAVEQHLTPYVVSVIGKPLVDKVRSRGLIQNILWKDAALDSALDVSTSIHDFDEGPLQLEYIQSNDKEIHNDITKRNMGYFLVLMFLPPRFHLLFQMEVCDITTLVRIRTDHWPCLAYIDEYLEALFLS